MGNFNFVRAQKIVDQQIRRFGGGAANASLRRDGVDRPITVVILQFSNRELQGSLIEYGDKRVLVSAKDLAIPPDNQKDSIILGGVEHRIALKPTPLAPDGVTVLYWEVVARK